MAELTVSQSLLEDRTALPGTDFLRGAAGMPVVRQIMLLFALAGSVALAVFAVMWMQDEDYQALAVPASARDATSVTEALTAAGITYRIDDKSGLILVPAGRIHEARMKLAGADLGTAGQYGYELLDREQGFGVSQFMEAAQHRRSLEGELARSILTITGVQQARVLLALPKSTTFIRDRRKPTASVTVTLRPGISLSDSQVKGIANLVAGAVPELRPESVAVVDQTGRLLSDRVADESLELSERQLAYVARIEAQLQRKVNNILERMLGPMGYTAEVAADVDFTRQEQAEEQFNPAETIVRSEVRRDEERTGNLGPVGIPGALSNQPPETGQAAAGDTETPAVIPKQVKSESTRNFEVDRTVSYTQLAVGRISRLTVSVVVDDLPGMDAGAEGADAEPPAAAEDEASPVNTTRAWRDEELAELRAAVQSAVGFSEARGDIVTVTNTTFYKAPEVEAETVPIWAQAWVLDLVKQVLGGLVLLLLAFGLLRPMFRNLSKAGEMVRERQTMEIADLAQARQQAIANDTQRLPAPAGEGQLRNGQEKGGADRGPARIDTVRELVKEDPGRVAQVVKHWVTADE